MGPWGMGEEEWRFDQFRYSVGKGFAGSIDQDLSIWLYSHPKSLMNRQGV